MATRKRRKPVTVEETGISVRLFQRGRQWWADLRVNGARQREPLCTTEKSTAETNARAFARAIAAQQLLGITPDTLTLGQLFAAYRQHRVPHLTPARKREAESRVAMFLEALGAELPIADVDQTRVQSYCASRRSLRIVAPGLRVDDDGRRRRGYRAPQPVRDGALDAEFRWLNGVINWACGLRVNGRPLLQANPLPRDAKARRAIGWPVEKNPRRPVASHDRYVRTRDRADEVDPAGRLRCILAIARYTARREDAICSLHTSDLLLTPARIRAALADAGRNEADAEHMPYGAIRWREAADKVGYLFITPISADARAEIDLYLRRSARVGELPLFSAPGRASTLQRAQSAPERPIRRDTAIKWLMRAERLAELPKLRGGAFHPYRRLWATERRHLPAIDVAAAGGWGDTQALTRIYQHADAAGVARAVIG